MWFDLLRHGIQDTINIGAKIYAGKQQAKIAKQQEELIKQREEQVTADRDRDVQYAQDLFNRDYYTNYTDTAEGRNMLNQMKDMYKSANQTSMLAGGPLSEEAKLARMANQTDQVAGAVSDMSAMGTQRKDAIQNRFDNQKQTALNSYAAQITGLYDQKQGILGQKMAQWDNFGTLVGGARGNAINYNPYTQIRGNNSGEQEQNIV